MTTQTALEPAPAAAPLARRLAAVALIWIAVVAIAFLRQFADLRADDIGYDFRYFWLAGQMWADGVSPYGEAFHETGLRHVPEGHVPVIWPYPPNFWWFSVWLGFFEMQAAWEIWLSLKVAIVPLVSATLALSLRADRMPARFAASMPLARLGFFTGHLVLMAGLGTLHFDLIGGQITSVILLGGALLLAGIARDRPVVAVIGLAILFVKPQIGLPIGLGLMLAGRETFRVVFHAGLLSLVLIVPPMLIEPAAVLHWLHQVGAYDGAAFANTAPKMSGVRHAVWQVTGGDIGNLAAMAITIAVAAGVALACRRGARRAGRPVCHAAADLVLVETVVVLALAPLHLYDFLFVGLALMALPRLHGPWLVAGLTGVALNLRPDDIPRILSDDGNFGLFPGTPFATVGMMILLVALAAPRREARIAVAARPDRA
ncbi:glycosyltransferase 87 family protein [Defluviimonas sp. SAOS-178_SWC]|uniref:glycosyltransferase 87 family protein n=1 Tax=Defluviimonas sp. SAOS-178_SWC TaxID=3121287 RepID=UPI0032213EF3